MRTFALMNQKGGVAKTTTAVNVGCAMAMLGRRVLMVDLDPQSHMSLHLGVEPQSAKGTYGVLTGQVPIEKAAVKVGAKLYCLPAHIDLAATEVELAGMDERERRLGTALQRIAKYFDCVFFDCPPSLGVLTLNALACATDVIVPLQTHFFALQGVGKLLETVSLVQQRMNPRLSVAGFVLCMYDSGTKLAVEVETDLKEFVDSSRGQPVPWKNAVVFKTRIRRNIKLAESPSHGKSIFDYAPDSNGSIDYRNMANELVAVMNGRWASFEPAAAPAKLEPLTEGGDAPPVNIPAAPAMAEPANANANANAQTPIPPAAQAPTLATGSSTTPAAASTVAGAGAGSAGAATQGMPAGSESAVTPGIAPAVERDDPASAEDADALTSGGASGPNDGLRPAIGV